MRGRYVQNAQRRLTIARGRLKGGVAGAGGGRGRGGLGGRSPMPWDSTAQREKAELGNQAADTRAALEEKYKRAQSELGFGSGADNPYSASAENKQQLGSNQRGITNASGSQLYAGSTVNAQSQARSAYDKTQKGLEDSYAEAQAAHTGGLAKTARDEQLGVAGIKEGALDRRAASTPKPLGVGAGPLGRAARGRVGGVSERQNIRRPGQARQLNTQARKLNARINRGRGRI